MDSHTGLGSHTGRKPVDWIVGSILQATTQIQEQTLTFIPKIIVVFLVLFFSDRGC